QSLPAVWFEWLTSEPRVYSSRSVLAVGTVIKALRNLHKVEKLDLHIAQFHERVNTESIVDPTPASARPAFIRLQPQP
ncbi:hypothetical protein PHMEG_00039708, partial [Phytophthora megakarya]